MTFSQTITSSSFILQTEITRYKASSSYAVAKMRNSNDSPGATVSGRSGLWAAMLPNCGSLFPDKEPISYMSDAVSMPNSPVFFRTTLTVMPSSPAFSFSPVSFGSGTIHAISAPVLPEGQRAAIRSDRRRFVSLC